MTLTDLLMRINTNLIAITVLGFIWVVAVRRQDRNDLLNRLFTFTMGLTMFALSVETVTCILNHRSGEWIRPVDYMFHILLFTMGPAIMLLWSLFIDFWIFNDKERIKKKVVYIAIPLVLNAILVMSAPLNGYVFSISESNAYQRGPLFYVTISLSYILIFYCMLFVIINRKHVRPDEFHLLVFFAIPAAIGGILQVFLYGILLMWSGAAFTMIVIYIYLQQRMAQVDSLTGVWTRGTLDRYLDRRISRSNRSGGFAAIMIDIDNFKLINDTYGHAEGDNALKNVVKVLRTALRKEDIVARYGGDEFVILLELNMNSDVEKLVKRIEQCFKSWNEVSGRSYKLEYSCGYSVYLQDSAQTMGEFLFRVDSLMYASKYMRKRERVETYL